jgi:hypothetical protein
MIPESEPPHKIVNFLFTITHEKKVDDFVGDLTF